MQNIHSVEKVSTRRFSTAFLMSIIVLILLGFLLLGRGPIMTQSAAGAALDSSLAAPNDVVMPIIFGGGDSGSGGTVYRDYNADGTQDTYEPGVPGIIVSAYTADGYRASYDITDGDGKYNLLLLAGEQYRLEVTGIPDYLQPGVVGSDSEASVAFVSGPDGNVDFGLNNPAQYCQDNPVLATPCYLFGYQGQDQPVIVSFNNRAGSTSLNDTFVPVGESPYDDANNDEPGIQMHSEEAKASDVGTTYGMAYQRETNVLFAGAFMKRHSGFGPGGTGAIYRIDRDSGTISTYVDLNAVFGANTAGANPHDSSGLSDPQDKTNFFLHDPSLDQVGKISLGDLEITQDEEYLYTVNLADKKLYRIPVVDQASPAFTTADIATYALPSPANCAVDDVRPFALAVQDGTLYAGLTCTAQSTQDPGDMRAYVYSFNGSSFAGPVIEFRLNYPRSCADRAPGTSDCGPQVDNKEAEWQPWVGTFADLLTKSGASELTSARRIPILPQPLLSDIEFANGYMILGLRDRNADMFGNGALDPRDENGDPVGFPPEMSKPTTLYMTVSTGDILAAAPDPLRPGSFILEDDAAVGDLPPTAGAGNGNGPGGGEYFFDEDFGVNENFPRHAEIAQGGLTNIPGQANAITTSFNPVPIDDKNNWFDGGIIWLSGANGTRSRSYRVFAGDPPPTTPGTDPNDLLQGKNNGLGDLEVFCDPAPLEIGDRVWLDADGNGIQDPGEQPLAGITVQLYAADMKTLLATAVTDAGGNYYFSSAASGPLSGAQAVYGVTGLKPNVSGYILRVALNQSAVAANNYALTIPNADGQTDNNNKTDLRDSDAMPVGENAEIMFDSGAAGHNNHTLDFGFVDQTQQPYVAIGNRVWLDNGEGGGIAGNGIVDGGEMGIGNVKVDIYPGTGVSGSPLASTMSSSDGCYLFDMLTPGDYILHIAVDQFADTAPLAGLVSSIPQGGDNGNDDNVDENGQNITVNGGISSTVINLMVGEEPVDEPSRSLCASTQPDANEDMTVDFGFYTPGEPMPDISIIKKTNGLEANEPTVPGVPQINPGDTVTWTYEVTNTGNVSFAKADVNVTDSQGETPVFDQDLVGNGDDFLDPGETWQYIATGVAEVVGPPEVPGSVPTLWGLNEDVNGLFTIDDYTKIPDGPAAAGYTSYGRLYFVNLDGVTQLIPKDIGSLTIDNDNMAYLAYNRNLSVGGGQPDLHSPVLVKFSLDDVSPGSDTIVTVVGSIPIPGFRANGRDDNISGMSFDPLTGTLYGLFRVGDTPDPDHLVIIDKTNAALVADLGEMRNDDLGLVIKSGEALESDEAGTFYVSDNWDDQVYSIDQTTAQITALIDNDQRGGLTGIGAGTHLKTESLAWDPLDNTMLAADDDWDLFFIQTLENGNNISLGSWVELTDVESMDFIVGCYRNVGVVTASVEVKGLIVTVDAEDASHYCN